ncbi:uncharacterized protein METZ01_LOCUS283610 [marine metagenome]|uniref:Uncharacterized protein n=1 Tax=marine metagenome TaxID=408172 RepID=A0A382L1Y0_9ZZZZ
MSAIDGINQPSRVQRTEVNRSASGVKQTKEKRFVAADQLDLGVSQAGNAAKQVESEFAARKAEILRQEKAGGYDPDKAMDYIAKRLAESLVEHR